MIFLLVFYVFYTLWWGYAIFHLFEGVRVDHEKGQGKERGIKARCKV